MIRIHTGDCREVLKTLPDASVNCCVTSPPYWGLRDYGVVGQIGMESTPAEFIAGMMDVFAEVWRVLRDDGTLWLNMGDSYSTGGHGNSKTGPCLQDTNRGSVRMGRFTPPEGLKKKDLVGMPWRVAFALQDAGWYLRADIIWAKGNCMPESVKDRPTRCHEYIFLMSKARRYYYNWEAIREPTAPDTHARYARGRSGQHKYIDGGPGNQTIAHTFAYMDGKRVAVPDNYKGSVPGRRGGPGQDRRGKEDRVPDVHLNTAGHGSGMRNKRSVWQVNNKGLSEAHFATFPPDLIRPCILAGCPMGGTVLEPFGGAGTTAMVAEEEGRNSVLIELNPEYAELAKKRTAQGGLFCMPNARLDRTVKAGEEDCHE